MAAEWPGSAALPDDRYPILPDYPCWPTLRGRHWKSPAVAQLLYLSLDACSGFGREHLDEGGAVGERRIVKVHQPGDSLGDPVRRACNHKTRVAMPQENDIVQILELEKVNDILYVSLQIHLRSSKMHPFTESREGDWVGVVTVISQPAGDGLPTPAPSQVPLTNT